MRRSICYCEPSNALAGEISTWQFVYTPAQDLPEGTLLRFDLGSEGRPIDWELPDTSLRKSGNIIYASTENGDVFGAEEIELEDRFTPLYEFELPCDLDAGSSLTITVGAPKGKKTTDKNGTMAQCTAQRRRNFYLYIDTTGKGHFDEPEVFTMDIRGNRLENIRIHAPTFVGRNKRFDIVVRFEDEYGNLTCNAEENTLIELTYENLRENLNWKLFIPETGFITLPNMYFNEVGTYTIKLRNTLTNEIYKGSPIKCFDDSEETLFWGLLHGESERIDSAENIENCLRHFRDEMAFNFYAASPFEDSEETPNEIWKLIANNVAEFDEPERFTTFLGFQYTGAPESEGHRQLIFSKDNKQIFRKKDNKGSTFKKFYKNFTPKELVSIPCFTMAKGHEFNFDEHDPLFEPVVEIYNAWGSSECSDKEGNTKPITTSGKSGIKASSKGSIVDALKANKRFGFVAGGLDDRGIYADLFESDQEQYSPGLTAIIAKDHSRASLIDALQRRSCYATTGEQMIIGFSIAGTPMGGIISTADKPGLSVNRHISGYAAGTANLKTVEIIRNGTVIKTFEPKRNYSIDFIFDDMDKLSDIILNAKDENPPFVFYYIRVTQEDGHIAWSSPIWVDYEETSAAERRAKRNNKAPKKVKVEEEPINFEIDDEEDEEEEEE